MEDSPGKRQRFIRLAALLSAVAALVILVLLFLRARICDEQLNNRGAPVDVCRHVQVTDPPVAILGIVLLGLVVVAFPIAEVSAFGISLKQRVNKVEEAAKAAEAAAESAQLAAAKATVDIAIRGQGVEGRSRRRG